VNAIGSRRIGMLKRNLFVVACLALAVPGIAYADNLSVEYSDKPAAEAFADLAQKGGATILVESSVKGKVTLSASDVSVENALAAVCKSLDVQWRKLYIQQKPGEELKADSLAAVVRIISAARLPDVIVSGSQDEKPMVFAKRTRFAIDADVMVTDTDLKPVYLVTNDRAAAKKAEDTAKTDDKPKEKTKAEKYADMQKEMMSDFLEMTPEERTEAMRQSMNMLMQMDPGIYKEMSLAAIKSMDSQMMGDMMRMNMQMVMELPTDQLVEIMKINMQAMQNLPPEVMQKMMEAAKAAGAAGGGAP